jgi:hypothetical protein
LEELVVCVTALTVLETGEIFEEDVPMRLRYHVRRWGGPGTLLLNAICSEDGRILVVSVLGQQACSARQESELSASAEMFLGGLHNVAVPICFYKTKSNPFTETKRKQ